MQSVMCAPIWSVTRRLWNGFQLPLPLPLPFAGCIFRQQLSSPSYSFPSPPPYYCCCCPLLPQVGSLNFWWWLPQRFAVMSECRRGRGQGGDEFILRKRRGSAASAADFTLGVFSQAEVDLFVSTLWWENSPHCSPATPTHLSRSAREREREREEG